MPSARPEGQCLPNHVIAQPNSPEQGSMDNWSPNPVLCPNLHVA